MTPYNLTHFTSSFPHRKTQRKPSEKESRKSRRYSTESHSESGSQRGRLSPALPPTPEVNEDKPRHSVCSQPFRKKIERPEYDEDPAPPWGEKGANTPATGSPAPMSPPQQNGYQQPETPCRCCMCVWFCNDVCCFLCFSACATAAYFA